MKFELILLTALLFFPFDNFGQMDSTSTIIRKTDYSFEPVDSCSTITKKNGNILVECYNQETQIIKTRTLTKTHFTRKWDEKGRITIWDENGKKYVTYIYRKKYISDPFAIRNHLKEIKSIRWYFIDKGRPCLKRKKRVKRVIHTTS